MIRWTGWRVYVKRGVSCPAAQRRALPAGGWDATTPFCRNQLQAAKTAWKRADSHHYSPGALPGFGCTLCWASAWVWKLAHPGRII